MKLVGIDKWRELDGDNTLALDWDLTEDSHVWEIGGFEGHWAQQMWDKFHCNITIFEPQDWAYHKLLKRFLGNIKITILPYGLWTHDDVLIMGNFETDGASVVNNGKGPHERIGVKDIVPEIQRFVRRHPIDLALMNIEGAEFPVLERVLQGNAFIHFCQFWAQFHPVLVENGDNRAWDLFARMEATHQVLWECYPTAVAWRRKDG